MTSADDSGSPFAPLLADLEVELPAAFRTQFLIGPKSEDVAVITGRLDRVWHRPLWLTPVFWVLGRFGVLFPDTGTDVPATLRISGGEFEGRPCQFWERAYEFDRTRHLDAVVIYDQRRRRLNELLGPAHVLEIEWHTRFEASSVRITVRRWTIRIGHLRLPVPSALIGTLRIRQTALDDDAVHLTFVHTHPVLGRMFGYEGSLRVRREALT